MGVGIGIDPGKLSGGLIPGGASILPPEITVDIWRNGLEQRAWSCHQPSRWYNGTCVTGGVAVDGEKTFDATQTNTRFLPFPVYSIQGCDTADLNQPEYMAMAQKALSSGLSAEFAKEITLGTYSGNPSFDTVATPISLTTDTNIVHAISQLIYKRTLVASVVGQMVLHVPIHLTPQLNDRNLIEARLDGVFLRGTNIRVSLDSYPGFTPGKIVDGSAGSGTASTPGTTSYITLTGPVEYGLGEVVAKEAEGNVMNLINQTASRVEQMGIFRFDPCGVYTVLVTD